MRTLPPSPRRQHRGATLIEVLIAILVLSIALLGIAGLVSASLRYSQGSWARSTVASALSDLADRVRTNPGSSTDAYVISATYAAQQASGYAGVAYPTDCMAAACTAGDDLAKFQLEQWRRGVVRTLPAPAVFVAGSRATGYSATVMWYDKSFLQADGVTPESSATCAAGTPAGIQQRACCPAAAAAPAGVRCTNITIVP